MTTEYSLCTTSNTIAAKDKVDLSGYRNDFSLSLPDLSNIQLDILLPTAMEDRYCIEPMLYSLFGHM